MGIKTLFKRFFQKRQNKGAGMAEYGLVVGLIAVGSIGGVYATGIEVELIFCEAASAIRFEDGCSTQDQAGGGEAPLAFGAYLPNNPVTRTAFTSTPSDRQMSFSYTNSSTEAF